MSSGKVYEMLWDCQFCGTKGNLGLTHRFCPSCGAPQNPDSRYYPSDEDKVAVEDHQYVGADVTCPSCGELNGAAAEFCGQCGGPLTEGARAKTLTEERRGAGGAFVSSGSRDVVKEKFDAEMARVGVTGKAKNKGGNFKLIAIIAVIVVIIGGVIAALTWKKEATLIVTGHEWTRTITIQEYKDFQTRDWRDSPPAGDNVSMVFGSCRQEQRSTRRVQDGETCETVRRDQGDGTYREERQCSPNYRDEPVYDDKCTWQGQRWEDISPAVTSGDLTNTPAWPSIRLNCEDQRRVGCQRESGREEVYDVLFEDEENKEYTCGFPQSEWADIPVESAWTGKIGVLVSTIDCDALVRQ